MMMDNQPTATKPEKPARVNVAPVPANLEKREISPLAIKQQKPEPTRYGDWERNGRCIDF